LVPVGDPPDRADRTLGDADAKLLEVELNAAVAAAFARLAPEDQRLLRLLTADPPIGYDAISEILGIPTGSIGPTRKRLLNKLRNTPELARHIEVRRTR
jgi:DNA-directed RNA polymerase specialized sigma24 family protein